MMHLLVLDDDPQIGAFVARVATGLGWTADRTTTPAEFRTSFAARRPDLIVLDLQLGDSDGVEQLRFLHNAEFRHPIVLMSGFDARVLAAAVQLGSSLGLTVGGILEKPVRANTIRTVLESVAGRHGPITAARIGDALDRGEMRLDLQPIVDSRTWQARRLEALIRWNHPVRGAVPPGELIPIAEADAAVIDRVTDWVLRRALAHYRTLVAADLDLPIAVNVSRANLHRLDFPDTLAALLAAANVPPDRLQLEVTESVATADPTAMLDILTRLRLKGIGVAIDDFGTGYSSLVALHRLPFTEIKIDKCFVTDVMHSREACTIVRSIADLARNLALRTVAEGVETETVAERLREIGVDDLQGHLFSAPLAIDALIPWLRGWAMRAGVGAQNGGEDGTRACRR